MIIIEYTCSLSKPENKGGQMPQVRKTDDLEKVSQNVITTYNVLTEARKMKKPIYLLGKNVKIMQPKSQFNVQPGGMVQSPEIQNLLTPVFMH